MDSDGDDVPEIGPSGGVLQDTSAVAGNAPWLRQGVNAPFTPDSDQAKAAVERLAKKAREQEAAAKELLRQRREAHAAEYEAERVAGLEKTAKTFFVTGCFALPWVHVIMWIFFWDEWKDPDASPVVKKRLKSALFVACSWTFLFAAWFATYQAIADRIPALNVLTPDRIYI